VPQLKKRKKITYHGPIPFLYLASVRELDFNNIKLHRVYCMKWDGEKITLIPAPDQENPRNNPCYRAVVYKQRDTYYLVKLSKMALEKAGMPREVEVTVEDDGRIILVPVN